MIKRGLALLVLLCMALPCAGMAEQTEARRVVYLTFDDGPKKDTPELLETLSELDVPATFFLVGLSVRAFPEYAKQIVQAGYAVGSHTMAHSIGRIQKDAEFVLRDLARFEKTMREEVDETFSTDLFRFPGGSTAYQSRVKTLVRDAGYAWFDWNTMTGDAQYTFSSDQEMLDYTLRQTEGKDVIILLMHEGKARTRRILPELVAYFREAGYEFRALSTSEEDRGILSRCGAHMMLPDAAQETVTAAVKAAVADYLKSIAFTQNYVSYARINAAILEADGVQDVSGLTVNGATANVAIRERQAAVLGEVSIRYGAGA